MGIQKPNSAHFPVEECPSSSMHILSVVSQVIGKGGEEHQVVRIVEIVVQRPSAF